MSLPIYVAVKL